MLGLLLAGQVADRIGTRRPSIGWFAAALGAAAIFMVDRDPAPAEPPPLTEDDARVRHAHPPLTRASPPEIPVPLEVRNANP